MLANVYKVNLPVPFSNLSSSKLVNNEYDCIEFSVLLLIGISTFPLFIISLHLARLDTLPVCSPTLRTCQLLSILLASWAIIWPIIKPYTRHKSGHQKLDVLHNENISAQWSQQAWPSFSGINDRPMRWYLQNNPEVILKHSLMFQDCMILRLTKH